MPRVAAILLAAGSSSRFGGREKKPFVDLDGGAVWLRSLDLFSLRQDVAQILIAVAEEDREMFDRRYRANVAFVDTAKIVPGGATRQESVRNALAEVAADVDLVAVHDTARPCVSTEQLESVLGKAAETGAAILACPVADTVKRGKQGAIVETVPRDGLWLAQTPQVFRRDLLIDAYARWGKREAATDDAGVVEAIGHPVSLVASTASNLKITTGEDLAIAEAILQKRAKQKPRGGFHPFADESMWR